MELTPKTVTTKNIALAKWGVRLIGFLLFVGAISDFYKLITGTRQIQGFLGFDLGLNHDGKPIDVMGWLGVVILIYVGVQLLRFQPSGRYWALFIFLVSTLLLVVNLVWFIGLFTTASSGGTRIDIANPQWLDEKSRPIAAILLFVGVIVFYCVPAYFLMRKDVKQLFHKPAPTGESH